MLCNSGVSKDGCRSEELKIQGGFILPKFSFHRKTTGREEFVKRRRVQMKAKHIPLYNVLYTFSK